MVLTDIIKGMDEFGWGLSCSGHIYLISCENIGTPKNYHDPGILCFMMVATLLRYSRGSPPLSRTEELPCLPDGGSTRNHEARPQGAEREEKLLLRVTRGHNENDHPKYTHREEPLQPSEKMIWGCQGGLT